MPSRGSLLRIDPVVRFLSLVAGCAAALVASAPKQATAQASDPEVRPTRGPLITNAARAGDADATAVELNPGGLALLPATSAELVGAAAADGVAMPRRGWGLFWGARLGFKSALGAELAYVARDSEHDIGGYTAFRLAYALELGRSAGFGVSWAHLWGGGVAGTDTFDAGLALRLGRYAALGVGVEDLGEPHPRGLAGELPRLWTTEIVLRPLGNDRVEMAVGAAHADDDRWKRFVPRARLGVRLMDGLRIYAEAQTVPVATTTGGTLAFRGNDTRVGGGLAVDFGHARLTNGAHVDVPEAGSTGAGWAGRLEVSAERRPSLTSSRYVARVALGGSGDDRAFLELVRRVRALAVDQGVAGVLFKVDDVPFGIARIEEVRGLIGYLRAHGKRTFAYAPSFGTRAYYLAAAADAVIVHPAGELSLTGMGQHVTFYKAAMDRIGVRVDLVRVAEYKGAMEPFVMTEQSAAVRANHDELLDDVFTHVVDGVAADRTRGGHALGGADVRRLIDRAMFTPEQAKTAGLIDDIADEASLEAVVGRGLGRRSNVPIRDPDSARMDSGMWAGRRVAVMLVDGTIVDGKSQDLPFDLGSFAGGDTLAEALERCRRDASVGAVVLRINSPGGSGFASDVVARAIGRLRDSGKPVVVSMADLAASGGYYIAAPADVIYAEPSTITGSIGVFGFKVDVSRLMAMLSLSVEVYKRGAHADFQSPYRSWTDEELNLVRDKIREVYDRFVDTVARGRRGRGLTAARVDQIGRGRVWTGARAQQLGLVDKLGGLAEAVDEAAARSGVPLGPDRLPEVEVLPPSRASALRRLLGLGGDTDENDGGDAQGNAALESEPSQAAADGRLTVGLLGSEARALLRTVAAFVVADRSSAGVLARLPYDIDIR